MRTGWHVMVWHNTEQEMALSVLWCSVGAAQCAQYSPYYRSIPDCGRLPGTLGLRTAAWTSVRRRGAVPCIMTHNSENKWVTFPVYIYCL